jgi:pyridoxal biosynthesis lyase PdxS
MRREVDLRAIMSRRRCVHRTHRHAGEISRRRTLGEMDVDQVDEAEVLTKRLKAMHV